MGKFDGLVNLLETNPIGQEILNQGLSELAGTEIEQALTQVIPITEIPLEQVLPRKKKYYVPSIIQGIKDSIASTGMLFDALLVRQHPVKEGYYEILAGHNRRESLAQLGWTSVPARICPVNDEIAAEIYAASNQKRKNPNPLEETESIIELLTFKLHRPKESVIALFYAKANYDSKQRRSKQDVLLREEEEARPEETYKEANLLRDWEVVEAAFRDVSQLSPHTFRTMRLPLLNWPQDLQNAVQEGLDYSKAQALTKLTKQDVRQALIEEILAHDLSVRDIRYRVEKLQKVTRKSQSDLDIYHERLALLSRKKKLQRLLDDPQKKSKIDKLLIQLEALFED